MPKLLHFCTGRYAISRGVLLIAFVNSTPPPPPPPPPPPVSATGLTKLLKIRNTCFENSETALPYLDKSMLLRNGFFFSIMVYLVSRDKSIQTLRIHQFEAKMGKYFAVDEAVVGKIQRNLICSRSVVHVIGAYVISVGLTLSGQTTLPQEKVEGVHKDGLVGEIRR